MLIEADRSSPPFSSPLLPPRRGATELEDSLLRPPPVLLYSFRSRSDALAHPYCRTVRQRRRIFSRKQRKRRKSAACKFVQPHPLKEVGKNLVSLSPSFARLSKNIRSNSPPSNSLASSILILPLPTSFSLEKWKWALSQGRRRKRGRGALLLLLLLLPSSSPLQSGACFVVPASSPPPLSRPRRSTFYVCLRGGFWGGR